MKDLILNNVKDLVSNFLYYDRKDDEDLPRGVIQEQIQLGNIIIEEIVDTFREELTKKLKEI